MKNRLLYKEDNAEIAMISALFFGLSNKNLSICNLPLHKIYNKTIQDLQSVGIMGLC